MKLETRVLNRVGARDLTPDEIASVTGGIRTLTPCTIKASQVLDGDAGIPGEC